MEEANRVYSKYVFKNSFYKPVPRVNRVIKADSSVAKEGGLINDANKRPRVQQNFKNPKLPKIKKNRRFNFFDKKREN